MSKSAKVAAEVVASETVAPQGWDVAGTAPEEDSDYAIQTRCPKCGKESTVRGLNWQDLEGVADVNGLDGTFPEITRLCANCSYRLSAAKKPMSAAQKDSRRRYNIARRDRIKAALALLEETEQA
jgi:hypothetical protein